MSKGESDPRHMDDSFRHYDSHIHLNSEDLFEWFEENHEEYRDWVFNNVSTTLEDFRIAIEQSRRYDNVYVTAGIHPLEVDGVELQTAMEELDRTIAQNRSRVIAIGETGLDFYRAVKELSFYKQQRWFYSQYELAKKYDLPLVLHVRHAHEEVLEMLEGLVDWRGVIHCFEANEEIMKRYLALPGEWMLSVSPVVLRQTSKFRHLIHKLDIGRILVESDAPFLGRSCREVIRLMEIISEEKRMNFDECRSILWNNFRRCFKLGIK